MLNVIYAECCYSECHYDVSWPQSNAGSSPIYFLNEGVSRICFWKSHFKIVEV